MVRTRFELKSVIDEIKNFTGSKEQEKAKVEELNRKYGESFGYYKTLSEWYDTLIQKSEDYVQVLLHQANVQNLVKKAAEADEEVNKIKRRNRKRRKAPWVFREMGDNISCSQAWQNPGSSMMHRLPLRNMIRKLMTYC